MIGHTLLASAAVTAAFQGAGCLHGWIFGKTEKLFDVTGALNSLSFLPLALLGGNVSFDYRKGIISSLFLLARLWLLLFLGWRNKQRGDARLDKFKVSLLQWLVPWSVQGIWVWCIALPVLVVDAGPTVPFGVGDYACSSMLLLGLLCEIVGDVQKARWVQQGREGGFCNEGLWKFSRHPNYFGEILMWWAAWGLTVKVGAATSLWFTVIALLSPLFTMNVLMFVPDTGLGQCEGRGLKRYYAGDAKVAAAFKEYRESTSILVPMVGWRCIPSWLKATVLFEWPCYAFDEKRA